MIWGNYQKKKTYIHINYSVYCRCLKGSFGWEGRLLLSSTVSICEVLTNADCWPMRWCFITALSNGLYSITRTNIEISRCRSAKVDGSSPMLVTATSELSSSELPGGSIYTKFLLRESLFLWCHGVTFWKMPNHSIGAPIVCVEFLVIKRNTTTNACLRCIIDRHNKHISYGSNKKTRSLKIGYTEIIAPCIWHSRYQALRLQLFPSYLLWEWRVLILSIVWIISIQICVEQKKGGWCLKDLRNTITSRPALHSN